MQSSFKNMVFSLGGICLVCAALLGVVYYYTAGPIAEAVKAKQDAAISAVLPSFDGKIDELEPNIYIGKASDGSVVGYAILSSASGYGGAVTLMTGITADGTIYNVQVLSHSETPGLGAKCTTDEGFYGQFRNLNSQGSILRLKKDGGSLNAISAATITSRAYTNAVNSALEIFYGLIEEENYEED
ncbi:MAG: RnfABCDGE type electron transport complex subunit G [Bacteroidales bacterium]|nr:RnfABCDGE type electron transport complex subunit G [Bacteroidales bacterium]